MTAAKKLDPTIYPDTDDMGEGELQQLINELFRPLLARFLATRGVAGHVGSNTFIYYKQFDSSKRIAPDVYLLPSVAPAQISRSWKLWELDRPPSFALEVVSLDVEKDYIVAPEIHDQIGTDELIVFDPERRGPDRHIWQVFQRHPAGDLRLALRSDGDRVRSRALDCHLRVVGKGDAQRLRVATGARGDVLFPTPAEELRAAEAANAELRAENVRLRASMDKAPDPLRAPSKRRARKR